MKKHALIIAPTVAVAALGLAGCSSDPAAESGAEPSPTVTEIDYGQQYLAIACSWNSQNDKYKKSWETADSGGYVYGVDTPKAYRKWAEAMMKESKRNAKAYSDAEWPKNVQKSMDKLAAYSYADVAHYRSRANKPDPADWTDNSAKNHQKWVGDIRLKLDLPPSGKGCKAYKKS